MNFHRSYAAKVIFKPCLVRAEWGSIEAMSGADQDEEEASSVPSPGI